MELRRLYRLAQPYRRPLALLALVSAAAAAVSLTVPWLAGSLIGGIIEGWTKAADQRLMIALLFASLTGAALLNSAASILRVRSDTRILADLRQHMFQHVQRLPIGFHESRGKGDTLALMTYEVARLGQFLTATLAGAPARLLTTIGAVVMMFRIDARLAIIVPILVPAFYLVFKIVGRSLRGRAAELQHAEAELFEIAEESLEMLPATKAFTRERIAADRYRAATAKVARLSRRQGEIQALIDPLLGLTTAAVAVIILLIAAQSRHEGQMNAAQLFSFLFYAGLLTRPVSALAHIYGETQVARGALERMQSVLEQEPEDTESGTQSKWRARGAIAFRDLRFAYPGREPLFENLSLNIAAGERVAIVGPNGAGKTALVNLVLRYHDPKSGGIFLDGKPIEAISLIDLRRQIGLVPQFPLLFNASIRDNIAFGAHGASDAAIERAAATAQALDFIQALPQGLDTIIGDRGVQMSGGQRQRIALARALIKDPPILILDEATSMFDLESEENFIATCIRALTDRTVIMITHRPAILELAERIIEISDGRVVRSDPVRRSIVTEAAE